MRRTRARGSRPAAWPRTRARLRRTTNHLGRRQPPPPLTQVSLTSRWEAPCDCMASSMAASASSSRAEPSMAGRRASGFRMAIGGREAPVCGRKRVEDTATKMLRSLTKLTKRPPGSASHCGTRNTHTHRTPPRYRALLATPAPPPPVCSPAPAPTAACFSFFFGQSTSSVLHYVGRRRCVGAPGRAAVVGPRVVMGGEPRDAGTRRGDRRRGGAGRGREQTHAPT